MTHTPNPHKPSRPTLTRSQWAEPVLERRLSLELAPIDRRALGLAVGATGALALVLLTIASLVMDAEGRFPLKLLANYFLGYRVSLPGAAVGAAWGFVTGFCGGWFLAFVRNLVVALWIMKVRIAADVESSREVLDQI